MPTWIINPWDLPFALVVRILNFLHVQCIRNSLENICTRKNERVNTKKERSSCTNLASPCSLVCRIRYLRSPPYAIFIFIPCIRLIHQIIISIRGAILSMILQNDSLMNTPAEQSGSCIPH